MIDRIQWLGHGSFLIQGPPLIYINPWRVSRSAFHPDAILITNDLYDHCSPGDIDKLRGPQTMIIANPAASNVLGDGALLLRSWQSVNVSGARITAVPAYTRSDYYPASKGGLGFVISIDYYDIYYAGTTDFVPELEKIRCDVAILPLSGGPGTLDLERTVELVRVLQPRWVIPSHWGTFGGTALDVQALERALSDLATVVAPERVR
ncbi:MAG: MBL fold metallo-hydrolase [Chloroflexota bacterium]|jgi:L-ascorbate metabolism protein UlaG (beta-lactamase superfamily)